MTAQSIKISPFDLLERGFTQDYKEANALMQKSRFGDQIFAYKKTFYESKNSSKKIFDMLILHRCSSQSESDYHCFDIIAKYTHSGKTYSRRVTPDMHNHDINSHIAYFVREYYRDIDRVKN